MRLRTMDLFDTIEDSTIQLEPRGVGNADRIMGITMAKINADDASPEVRRRSVSICMLAAVIVIFLMGTTVFAYTGFTQYENPIQMLHVFFGNHEYTSQAGGPVHEIVGGNDFTAVQPTVERVPVDEDTAQDLVASNITGVGQSVTHDGYTLTVIAHMHDAVTGGGTIYYTLENPAGVSGYSLQYDGEVWWPNGEKVQFKYCFDKSYIIAGETTDTKLSVASYYSDTALFDEDHIEIGFYGYDETIRLTLNYGAQTSSLVSDSGEIVITPTGMEICLQNIEFLYITDTDGTILPPMDDNHVDYLAIRFKDGSEYVVQQDRDGSLIQNYTEATVRRNPTYVTFVFNRLIDINEVALVIINDVEFGFTGNDAATDTGENGPMSFDQSAISGAIARGNLHHEILGIRVVTNAADIPEEGGFQEYRPACTYDSAGNETIWEHPSFIQEDGTFVDDVRLILLDVEITSENAYQDYVPGYDDPYIFRIDGMYRIREIHPSIGDHPMNWIPAYFSGLNDVAEHPFAYHILPGETKRFTVGFLIGNDYDGTPRELSSLCIRVPFGLLEDEDYYENLFPLVSE